MDQQIPLDPKIVVSRGSGGMYDPGQTYAEGLRYIWKELEHGQLNGDPESSDVSGEYFWFPIKIIHVKALCCTGRILTYTVLMGETSISKKDRSLFESLPREEYQLRSGGRRAIYEIIYWEKIGVEYDEQKIRDVEPDEVFD